MCPPPSPFLIYLHSLRVAEYSSDYVCRMEYCNKLHNVNDSAPIWCDIGECLYFSQLFNDSEGPFL